MTKLGMIFVDFSHSWHVIVYRIDSLQVSLQNADVVE